MVLPRNICETLWPVFSCKNLICHIKNQQKKEITAQPIDTSCKPTRNPIVSPTRQASPFGAEGASASMADRAVRAARL
jgi:hypothetical protein